MTLSGHRRQRRPFAQRPVTAPNSVASFAPGDAWRGCHAGKERRDCCGCGAAVDGAVFCEVAIAQNASARIAWYGVYTISKSKEIKDSASPTGSRFESTPVPPSANTDRIPIMQEFRFGFGYVLSGRGRTVALKRIYRFPPSAATGKASASYSEVTDDSFGITNLMGWKENENAEPGLWTFEVWQGDRKLLEQSFTLYKP